MTVGMYVTNIRQTVGFLTTKWIRLQPSFYLTVQSKIEPIT